MTNHLLRSVFLLLLVATMTALWAQESKHRDKPGDRNQLPRLEPVFSDDFSKDTRGDYTIQGDVSWVKGKFTLGQGASIQRAINGGAWAKVELDVELPELTALQPRSDLRVWFLLDGPINCLVRLQTMLSDHRRTASLALIAMGENDGKPAALVVRQTQLNSVDINRLTVEYRHELVHVSMGDRPVLIAYIDKPLGEVTRCGAQIAIASAEITRLAVSHTRPARDPSPQQQEQLASAKAANTLLMRLYRQGKFAEAARVGREVLQARRAILGEQHPDYAQSLNNLAAMYCGTGDYARAEPLYKQAIQIKKAVLGEQHPDYARSLHNLGGLYARMSNFIRAEPLLKQAMAIRKAVVGEQHPDYAMSLNDLAGLYQRMGDYSRAEAFFRLAMEIRKSALGEQHPDYAQSLNNLAQLYANTGDYARAEPLYKRALAIMKVGLGEQHPSYATSLDNLAVLYVTMGDYARAEPLYKQALAITKAALGDQHLDYASNLNNLAQLYVTMKNYALAEPLYKQALAIMKVGLGEQHPSYATSLSNLAGLYESTRDFARAEPLYKQGLAITKAALGDQHPSYAASLNNLAVLYANMGDHARAEPLCKQAMAITKNVFGSQHPKYATSLNNMAVLYSHLGDYVRAEPLLAEAASILRRQLDNTSLVQSERQQKKMQSENRDFIDNFLSNSLRAAGNSNAIAQRVWRWKGAVTLRQQAYRQVAAQPKLAPLFVDLQSVSSQLSAASGQTPVPPPVSASETAHAVFKQKRKLWEQRFTDLSRLREDLEQQIAAESQPFRRVRQPLSVAAVQSTLPRKTALVDFLAYSHSEPDAKKMGKTKFQRRYIAFVVRRDAQTMMVPLGSEKSLADLIMAFRRPLVGAQNPGTLKAAMQAGQRLRNELWLPIEKHLAGIDTVIISPDTALGTLPFAALPGKKQGSYLLEDYRIASVPMANLLRTLYQDDAARPKNTGLLVLGNVDYDAKLGSSAPVSETPQLRALASEQSRLARSRGGKSRQWASLPGFRAELETVRSLYQQRFGSDAPVATLSGKQATVASLLEAASQVGTLHLITHGYFEDASVKSIDQANIKPDAISSQTHGPDPFINTWMPGLLSGLVLAGANRASLNLDSPGDGILRASEIEAASLQGVDLVVLSACETGLGSVAGGEGLTGLQRAFQIAGARTVVASLWKVDDRATQELMRRFYTNLWRKKMGKLDAMRDAQLWMLRHPKQLETLGVKDARTRGEVRKLKPTAPDASQRTQGNRTAPYYWAAFQLSGDWR